MALTSALAASLNGAMFVLDEPSVGLHPVDVRRLAKVVRGLAGGLSEAKAMSRTATRPGSFPALASFRGVPKDSR